MASDSTLLGWIGALTGPLGLLLGYVNFRRIGAMKALDLRLQLRKSAHDLRISAEGLAGMIDRGKVSRERVSAATGVFKSGAMKAWLEQVPQDRAEAESIFAALPPANEAYAKMSVADLEGKLLEIHALEQRCKKLVSKYAKYLEEDDRDRAELKAAHRRTWPNINAPLD